jgi:hypothetical protein
MPTSIIAQVENSGAAAVPVVKSVTVRESQAGLVTLATKDRDGSATLEISSSRDCLAPRAHRRGAECAM